MNTDLLNSVLDSDLIDEIEEKDEVVCCLSGY